MADGIMMRVIENRFPAIIEQLTSGAAAAVADTANAVAGDARNRAPRLTGALADSIEAHEVGPTHWEITASIRYAAYVEYGTAEHGGPQPYMVPAAHGQEPAFDAAMRGIIR